MRRAPSAQACWILSNRSFSQVQVPVVQKIGTACAWEASSRMRERPKSAATFRGIVVSPLLFLVTSQHNIPHTSLDTGGDSGGYTDLLHLQPRKTRQRSSSTLQICGGGLKWRRYITVPSGSFCPCSCWLALSVDLADTYYRSICLGRPHKPDPPGSNTSSCGSSLDTSPP
jgi:hypothetical protein